MKKFKKTGLLMMLILGCVFFHTQKVNAQRVTAADLTYTYIGNNKYEITLTVYKDCAVFSALPSYYLIGMMSPSCNVFSEVVRVNLFSKKEISASCPSKPSYCAGGNQPGFDKSVYKGEVTITEACNDWQFSWLECPRPSYLNNISSPLNSCISTIAILNNKDFGNVSSPTFNAEQSGFVCKGSSNNMDLGIRDPNGDSLVVKSITPYRSYDVLTGNPILVSYNSGFSPSEPLSTNNTFNVNSKTGEIRFTPSVSNQKAIIAIQVEKYRNKKLVSKVMKDQQIFVYDCTPPTITFSGFNPIVCANTPVRINFGAIDSGNNKTSITWDNGISGAFFTVPGTSIGSYTQNQTGYVLWTPNNSQSTEQSFTIKVKNDACPIYGESSYRFSFTINRTPEIVLREDTLVPCGKGFPLKVRYAGGKTPYISKGWSTGATSDSIFVSPGKYFFSIVDGNNCSVKDSVILSNGIGTDFNITSLTCAGRNIQFNDLTTSLSSIASWEWNFGTNGALGKSTQRNPSFVFNSAGIYDVSLKVVDRLGCSDTKKISLAVCSNPTYSLTKRDTCVNGVTIRFIATSSICAISNQTIFWGDPDQTVKYYAFGAELNTISGSASFGYPWDPSNRNFNIAGEISNTGGCSATANTSVRVYPRPVFIDPMTDQFFPFNCSQPTLTLSGLATVTVQGALPPLRYYWSGAVTTLTSIFAEPSLGIVSTTGDYTNTVVDARGCTDTRKYSITYPIIPRMNIMGKCAQADTNFFSDNSIYSNTVFSRTWDFGDGTTITGLSSLYHVFPDPIQYRVTLRVRDVTGCDTSVSKLVNNDVPKFTLAPAPSCYGTNIQLIAPSSNSISGIIDKLRWKVTNISLGKDSVWYRSPQELLNPKDLPLFNPTVQFLVPGTNTIYCDANYNYSCTRTFRTTAFIYNDIKEKIVAETNTCYNIDKPLRFRAYTSVSDNPIVKRTWDFIKTIDGGTVNFSPIIKNVNGSSDSSKIVVNDTVLVSVKKDTMPMTSQTVRLLSVDDKGCFQYAYQYYRNERLPKIVLEFNPDCWNSQNAKISIQTDFNNADNSLNMQNNVWFIKGRAPKNLPDPGYAKPFVTGGKQEVGLAIFNFDKTCTDTIRQSFSPYASPAIDFDANTACLGDSTKFINKTTPGETASRVVDLRWDLGTPNGLFSTQNVNYIFSEPKTHSVKLWAKNDNNCVDSIVKTVTVHPRPKANFMVITDYNNQQSGSPIDFKDITSFSDNIVKWKWKFTKKDSTTFYSPMDPSFTFDSIQVYNVLQRVTNSLGCSDDTTIRLDLNAYLILPTAFSPNGDTQNDQLFLLYKGIKQLKEFKIYNRFGEKVFDAGQNLNAVWDGTQNGLPSPVGAYVYYVEGTTLYGKVIGQKGQVTLLR